MTGIVERVSPKVSSSTDAEQSIVPKKVAIVQSCYIPWKGYFDLINSVDEFILFEDAQYTKRDWRNRNVIKTREGLHWLTIPVLTGGKFRQAIKDTVIADCTWTRKHWATLTNNYAKAPCWKELESFMLDLYRSCEGEHLLSTINYRFITAIMHLLGIKTGIRFSMEYSSSGDATERIIGMLQQAGADIYLSGPRAKAYLREELFAAAGIEIAWMDYSGYREYHQMNVPPFIHQVSILDLLFCEGPARSREYMLSFGGGEI